MSSECLNAASCMHAEVLKEGTTPHGARVTKVWKLVVYCIFISLCVCGRT